MRSCIVDDDYKISDMVTIVILGSICGLKNTQQIHQWALKDRIREFLKEDLKIYRIPSYYWFTCILKIIKPESLNNCFENWVYSVMPEKEDKLTISLGGKTIRSTNKMKKYDSALHIISAQIGELGLTLAQNTVDGKSNEIPAVQKLLKELNIKGALVTADALNCQKETAKIIVGQKADYLLSVKENHPTLKKDIEDFVQDAELQKTMKNEAKTEKNRDRIETRTAYVTHDINWLPQKEEWKNLCCSCHPIEPRPFNIRENARIQSFPDEWQFCGGIGSQYKQVGNAVPVNLAYDIALEISKGLEMVSCGN